MRQKNITMEIRIREPSDKTVIIQLNGRFNIEEVHYFENEIENYIVSKQVIALDMSGIKYIDSSGIGSLIKTMNRIKNISKDFILFDIKPEVRNIFEVAYLNKFFTILTKDELIIKYPDLNN